MYSLAKNYIPVVDTEHYKTLYASKISTDSWYCFFDRDENVPDLATIYKKHNFILSNDIYLIEESQKFCGIYGQPSKKAVEFYSPYLAKYFRLRKDIYEKFERDFSILFSGKVVLGVHVRGTDMKYAKGHPVPCKLENYLMKTEHLCKKYSSIDVIFVGSDEESVILHFKEKFQSRVVCLPAYRSKLDTKEGIHRQKNVGRKNNGYYLALEVLEDSFFLSKCDYLLCGYSNVSKAAILNNGNKYKEVIVLDSGKRN